jgi:hypothetical protein
MPATEYCVYNETRSHYLAARVTLIDARTEPLKAVKVLIEGLAPSTDPRASSAIWLNPLRSVPAVPRLSPYDLVYLDDEGRVVHGVELVPDDKASRFDGPTASALVLPIHSFIASRSLPGDRVILCPAADFAPADVHAAKLGSTTESTFAAAPSLPIPNVAVGSQPVPILASAPTPVPIPALSSDFAANPFLPAAIWGPAPSASGSFLPVQPVPEELEPVAPVLAAQSTPPQSALVFADASLPSIQARKLLAFDFLRSIARLNLRVQVSITVAPHAATSFPAPAPVSLALPQSDPREPAASEPAQPAPEVTRRSRNVLRVPGTSLVPVFAAAHAAVRSRLRRWLRAWSERASSIRSAALSAASRLSDRCGVFCIVTLPIFFEHTLPSAADRSRRSVVRAYDAYAHWADAFFYRAGLPANDRPAIDGALRKPPSSVRPAQPRTDPLRQLLRPRN